LEQRGKDEADRIEDNTTAEFERYEIDEGRGDGIGDDYG